MTSSLVTVLFFSFTYPSLCPPSSPPKSEIQTPQPDDQIFFLPCSLLNNLTKTISQERPDLESSDPTNFSLVYNYFSFSLLLWHSLCFKIHHYNFHYLLTIHAFNSISESMVHYAVILLKHTPVTSHFSQKMCLSIKYQP